MEDPGAVESGYVCDGTCSYKAVNLFLASPALIFLDAD